MINWIGLWTIFRKEIERTRTVIVQSIIAPTLTTALYFIVFGAAVGNQITTTGDVSYKQFIVPGLIMMALVTNAMIASASGIYFPRFLGIITDLLAAPMDFVEITFGYTIAAAVRATIIGVLIYLTALFFTPLPIAHPLFVLIFGFLSAWTFACLGMIMGLWAKDFERLFLIPSIVLTPLTFLGGVFYKIDMLPPLWQKITMLNPIFYMIDGLRYGFFGISSTNHCVALSAITVTLIITLTIIKHFFTIGYGLRK
ncbi:MAG: ABC transporter permease [Candidatus Moranbacteria bacterium]|nr:ABC transporter permease [Candidatus Moranbacteria bacterium]